MDEKLARRLFDRPPKNAQIKREVDAWDDDVEYYDELNDDAEQFHEECGDR